MNTNLDLLNHFDFGKPSYEISYSTRSRTAQSPHSTNPMQIISRVHRKIVIQHVFHLNRIQTPTTNVSRRQYFRFARNEFIPLIYPDSEILISVDISAIHSDLPQKQRQPVARFVFIRENQHRMRVVLSQF